MRVKDLGSGADIADVIPGVLSELVWTADSKGFLYALVNEHWRTDRVRWHKLGEPVEADVELFHEADEGFRVGVGETQSREWLIVSTGDHVTSEVYLLPADNPAAPLLCVAPRRTGREYDVDEHDGTLFIHTNDSHTNWRLVTAPVSAPGEWTERIAAVRAFLHDRRHLLRRFLRGRGARAGARSDRAPPLRARDRAGADRLPRGELFGGAGRQSRYAVAKLRLGYESMVTPGTVYDYDVATGALATLKVQEIPSGYDASRYRTERLKIKVRDGTEVPVSIVYPKDFPRDGSGRLYLYSYGAYGIAMSPGFSTSRLSFLDRGMAFAIAHIRGGDDLGQQWYLDGKLEKRTNTFNDFVDCAKGPDRARLRFGGQHRDRGALGGGRADGGGGQFGSRAVGRGDRRRAVRRRAQHDARRQPAAHAGRMARMGQSDRGCRRLRVDPKLFALR